MALLGAVVCLLMITCVNVTNVLVGRFMSRQHEIGIRAALGAGRLRQVRQFLVETALIFGAGAVGGLLITLWLRDYLVVLIPSVLRDQLALGEIALDFRVVGFAGAVTAAAALFCGGFAGLRALNVNLQQVLKDGGRASGSVRHRLAQTTLVVAEISLALVLLVGAALLVGHLRSLQQEDLGFDPEDVLTLRVMLDGTGYDSAEQRSNLVRGIEQAVGAVPGISAVGLTTVNPVCCGDWGAQIAIDGREPANDGSRLVISHRYVSPGLFEALDVALQSGRLFSERDDARAEPVVIIDQRMAQLHFPGESPIGKRLRLASRESAPWRTIIGVIDDVKDMSDYDAGWYLPFHQDAATRGTSSLHFMVRLDGEPEDLLPAVQRAVWDVAPSLAMFDVRMMTELTEELVASDRLAATAAGVFALLGTLLAGFGVYGLMAFFVAQQRIEIGTRLALGARPTDVLAMVLRKAMAMAAVGLVVGVAASIAMARVLAYFVAGVGTGGLPTIAAVAALLALATAAATWIPARRAARVDPMIALRSEG